tara:strand:- start:7688 stop:8656 length:969 start_codon:yes stop_codon:yes gene_type:complete
MSLEIDMIKLADALGPNINEQLRTLKQLSRNRSEELGNPEPVFGDWSFLSHDSLEANDWIERGEVTLTGRDVPYCGRCQEGWHYERHFNGTADTARMCQHCEVPRRFISRLNKLRLPADAIDMHFKNYKCDSQEQFEALDYLRRWIQRDPDITKPPALFLFGTSGNGKSSALYCLAREAAYYDRYHDPRRRRRARYISHSSLMSAIRSTFNDRNAKDPLKNWLNGVNLLLVDELGGIGGSANKSAWWVDQSIQIIEQIYRMHRAGELAVVFTSNLHPNQLIHALNDNSAVRSRLTGMFKHSTIQMKGRDRRIDSDNLGFWGR